LRYNVAMQHRLLADPFVAAEIDEAVAPFQGRLEPEELAWMRDQLAHLCETDPEAAAALKGAHPRHHPGDAGSIDASGERAQPWLEDSSAGAAADAQGRRKAR
jgi:hypothetical protein